MRRICTVCLILSLLLGMAACGGGMTWQEQYELGTERLAQGDYQGAAEAFGAAIDLDPEGVEAYVGRADAYLAGGEQEQLAAAAEDYRAALALDGQREELYGKLSQTYQAMGELEQSVAILEEGADALDSEALRQLSQLRQAENYTDEQLLARANELVWTVFELEYAIPLGAYFEQDWNNPVQPPEGMGFLWYPVVDERVESLADVEAYWHQYFADSCPLPEQLYYREMDGKLYTENMGIGDDITLLDCALTDVDSREGTHAVLTGYVLRRDGFGPDVAEHQDPFRFELAFEDGVWKCAGYEEGGQN